MESNIQAILFDMDGTLTDLYLRWILPIHDGLIAIKEDYDQENLELNMKHVIRASANNSRFFIIKIFNKVAKLAKLNFFQTLRFYRIMIKNRDRFKYIELIDGAENVVFQLKKNYKLALVTTASRSTINAASLQTEMFDSFEYIITRDDVKKIKPDPEPIFKALELLNIPPENSIMIGDFPLDVEAGKNAGSMTLAVKGPMGKYTSEYLIESNPDYIVDTLDDILKLSIFNPDNHS